MDKIKIYGLSIPICLVLASILLNSSYAQSTSNFLIYSNDSVDAPAAQVHISDDNRDNNDGGGGAAAVSTTEAQREGAGYAVPSFTFWYGE